MKLLILLLMSCAAIGAEQIPAEQKSIVISPAQLGQVILSIGAQQEVYWENQYLQLQKCIRDCEKQQIPASVCLGDKEL